VTGDRWKHVNCGSPDGVNGSYPYNPCVLDDKASADPATHYGFDPLTLQVIAPNMAGDYMSYAGNRWVSDYSYKGMIDELNNTMLVQANQRAESARSVESVSGVVVVSGVYSPTVMKGELDPAWAIPSGEMQQTVLRKLNALNTRIVKLHNQMHTQSSDHTHDDTAHATVRLLDANGVVLASKPIIATTGTHGGGNSYGFLDSLPIPNGTVALMDVVADDNTVIMSRTVSANAPTIALTSPAGGEAIDTSMTLSWTASDADDTDARYYTLQYSANNGKTWRALFTNLPSPIDPITNKPMQNVSMLLDKLSGLPGSDNALMRIMVSDGYNTASATSQPFKMSNRAPEPHIVAPSPYTQYNAGQMILLKGNAMDAEQGGLPSTSLSWSVDGVAVGMGSDVIVNDLAPGEHTAQLSVVDNAGNPATASITFTVAPLAVPLNNTELALNGDCNDAGYSNATHLSLAPYADGSRADVQLVRSDTQLWACFTGLKVASGSSPYTFATLRIDPNFSRDAGPQADDVEILLFQSGFIETKHGTGTSWEPEGTFNVNGRVRTEESGPGLWNAELQVDASVFGGWNKVVGLMVDHNWVTAGSDDHFWPRGGLWYQPNTWAKTVLGDLPQLAELDAASAYVGDGDSTITLTGSSFISDTQAYWNGEARPSTYVSATQLTMNITAADLTNPSTAQVQVANTATLDGVASNSLPFLIRNRPQVSPPSNLPNQLFLPMLSK